MRKTGSLLEWLGVTATPHWDVARPLGKVVGALLVVTVPLMFIAALAASLRLLWASLLDPQSSGLGTGTLIVALLGAPFLVWRTIIAQRTLGFQKEGHITDRISKAVEQLGSEKTVRRRHTSENSHESSFVSVGSDNVRFIEETVANIEVRLGAILSLERISQDSVAYDQGRDHVRVMEILCAYVRENAPASTAIDNPHGGWRKATGEGSTDDAIKKANRKRAGTWRGDGTTRTWAKSLAGPREDIALALKVIGRRTQAQRAVEAGWGLEGSFDASWVFDAACPTLPRPGALPKARIDEVTSFEKALEKWKDVVYSYRGFRIDLRRTNLQGADLSNLNLSGAILSGARLEGACLDGSYLVRADLSEARLDGATCYRAHAEAAELHSCYMEAVGLSAAWLQGASMSYSQMQGASFNNAHLEAADLWGADFEMASLQGASLALSDSIKSNFKSANLSAARFELANMSEALFDSNTLLSKACLERAVLRGNYSVAGLTQDQVDGAFGDGSVILPSDLQRPEHWPSEVLGRSLHQRG